MSEKETGSIGWRDLSLQAAVGQGGKVLIRIRHFSAMPRYAAIEDPAGAVYAIDEEK